MLKRLKQTWAITLLAVLMLLPGIADATKTVTHFLNDPAGNPIAAIDNNGNLLWKETYLPYGEQAGADSPAKANNEIWFHGKPHDQSTGLSYFQARYYDPMAGRFMGIDPEGFDEGNIHSFNRYAYGNNNPYRFVDRDGRRPGECSQADAQSLARPELHVQRAQNPMQQVSQGITDGLLMGMGGAGSLRAAGLLLKGEGVLDGANFAQKTFSSSFSKGGAFAGKSIEDVTNALRSGGMKTADVPIDYIIRDGNKLILNTRSAQALEGAGIPRSQWNSVNRTGQEMHEARLTGQLQRNGLTSQGTSSVRPAGGQ